jgi:hypothetical protein
MKGNALDPIRLRLELRKEVYIDQQEAFRLAVTLPLSPSLASASWRRSLRLMLFYALVYVVMQRT